MIVMAIMMVFDVVLVVDIIVVLVVMVIVVIVATLVNVSLTWAGQRCRAEPYEDVEFRNYCVGNAAALYSTGKTQDREMRRESGDVTRLV